MAKITRFFGTEYFAHEPPVRTCRRAPHPGPEWRVLLEISVANGEEYSIIRFPTNADKLKTDQWLLLDLK